MQRNIKLLACLRKMNIQKGIFTLRHSEATKIPSVYSPNHISFNAWRTDFFTPDVRQELEEYKLIMSSGIEDCLVFSL